MTDGFVLIGTIAFSLGHRDKKNKQIEQNGHTMQKTYGKGASFLSGGKWGNNFWWIILILVIIFCFCDDH